MSMKQINPAWLAAVQGDVNVCPYFSLLSMRIDDLAWGTSRLVIDVANKHMQPFGLVHGGAYASLVDAAGFWAAYSQLDPDLGMTTVDLKMNFLAPSQAGQLVGLGRAVKVGRTLSLAEARVEDQEGNLLAHGLVTLMSLGKLRLEGQDALPPKYAP
ncbi:MAG: PaaI family thioesterase [Deltaproteobacteria bacterium]|nr:PaaI family thioesterase [Deltaproteobacteria bacterium]